LWRLIANKGYDANRLRKRLKSKAPSRSFRAGEIESVRSTMM
jgi:hypothetical protein